MDIDSISGKGWISPISEEEVLTQLSQLSDTVAGPDRIPRKTMRELNPKTLVTHFNLYLKAESLPEALLEGRTVFVPKEEGTQDPLEHRPTTNASIITRVFHKCLAERCSDIDNNIRQKGFKKEDGTAINSADAVHRSQKTT